MRALSVLCALLAAAAATPTADTVPATETDLVTKETMAMTETALVLTETDFVSTEMASMATETVGATEMALGSTEAMAADSGSPTSATTAGEGEGEECATAAPPLKLLQTDQPNQEHIVAVEGGTLQVRYTNGGYLHVICVGAATLDGPLPRAQPATRVRNATLQCAPPRCGYAAALARLGVGLAPPARLSLALPPRGAPLAAPHLAGLDFAALLLSRASSRHAPPAPRAGLLAGRATLSELQARAVPLPPDALGPRPPPRLTRLRLEDSAPRVPPATLAQLEVLDAHGAELEGEAPALRRLSLTLRPEEPAPAWGRFPALTTLTLTGWSEPWPVRWTACGALTSLRLTKARAEKLPARWLAACPALEHLQLSRALRLKELPPALLEGEEGGPSPALVQLELLYGALESLPKKFFDPVPNLRYLDLKSNNLHVLSGGIFSTLTKLETLNLSKNKFANSSVYQELGVLTRLESLDLSYNRRLGDACPGDSTGRYDSGDSHLHRLKRLTALNLSFTEVTRICRDWREGMPRLLHLRLCYTNITHLSFLDLQYERAAETLARRPLVELTGSRVATVAYSPLDAVRASTLGAARASVQLSEPLACDCELYRALRALRDHPAHADLAGTLRCAGGEALATVSLDDLLCPANFTCPPRCDCFSREEGASDAPLWRVRVRCEDAGLEALPSLPAFSAPVTWDLQLARNRILELDDLPQGLLKLDLQNNSVRTVSARAAHALQGARDVLLAGNPLACGCGAAPLLRVAAALAAAAPRRLDAARCADGSPLAGAAPHCAAPAPAPTAALLGALGAVLAALALTALGAGAVLARPASRARLKGVLLGWGWLPRGAEEDVEGSARRYDAFVSFAHEDAEWVRALAGTLEAGGLRLCLHERDWAPGEHIGAQIAASVRSARRTLVVVSQHFLRSQWARAEFREALAAEAREGRPRLLVLLREEPRALPLDRALRRYLATNTYLRTDHPRFLPLLRRALPRPRPAPAPPPPPPADCPPAAA